MTDQWPASPVLGDVAENPVLDLIPFTRAGWKVAHVNRLSQLIRQFLQRTFPKTASTTVTATAISSNQQLFCISISLHTHLLPPATDGFGGKVSGIVIDSHTHPTFVLVHIEDVRRQMVPDTIGRFLSDTFSLTIPANLLIRQPSTSDLCRLFAVSSSFLS